MRFRPEAFSEFHVADFDVDPAAGTAVLRYRLGGDITFEERLDLGPPTSPLTAGQETGLHAVVRLLHIVAGVSYYKAAAPPCLVVHTGELSEHERALVEAVYDDGLREFRFRNGILERPPVEVVATGERHGARAEPPPPGMAVAMGGGKDSVVVLEALRPEHPVLVAVNPGPVPEAVAAAAGLPLAAVGRRIDQRLLALNEQGALNGHIPITAVNALLLSAAGYLHGYDAVVLALEGSADEPTRIVSTSAQSTLEVNHQWSKSSAFESLLRPVLAESVHPRLSVTSPIRSLSELAITRCFARFDAYLPVFRSCNKAFRLAGAEGAWCRDCPKCRFVFLALAVALDPERVSAVFGGNMLDDPGQVDGFRDLASAERKPFECVGTLGEVVTAFAALHDDPQWRSAVVVKELEPVVAAMRALVESTPPLDCEAMLTEIRGRVTAGSK